MKLNKDIKTRDEIIFGKYDPKCYSGGTRYFNGLIPEVLQKLVDKGFADPNDAQNCAPTIQELLDFTKDKDGYTFGGYVVSDNRSDYRVSVDSIDHDIPLNDEEFREFTMFARSADEFDPNNGSAWWD